MRHRVKDVWQTARVWLANPRSLAHKGTEMTTTGFTVAALQFPVGADVSENARYIHRLMTDASERGASVVITPETALTGYAWSEVVSWDGFAWDVVRAESALLFDAARRLGVTLLLGSTHFVDDDVLPMNCVYIVVNGEVTDRYDKCMLTDPDQLMYSSGDRPVVLEVGGLRCGILVCYDICYPEMYARYRDLGVDVVLHAFYNAGFSGPNILDELKPAWIRVRAADNRMHLVAVNSSRAHASWGSRVARPDGSLASSLDAHETGVLLHRFPDDELAGWLHNFKPMRLHTDEVFHRGRTASEHPRVRDRRAPP
jgi:predicted amidohydrolase